jgi:predicted N-acetyltransferase YhbS
MNVKIRPMIKDDIDFIIYANKKVHEASNQTSEIIEFKERLIKDILSINPKAYVIVALDDNNPIGMALYSTIYFADEGQIMWLSNIFVKEDYRNKKVAKAMIKYLKNVCEEKGYYAICGAVENSNELSKYFFNSLNSRWLENFKMIVIK